MSPPITRGELWHPSGGLWTRRGRDDVEPDPPDPPSGQNFGGDPGEGEYIIGWALGPNGNSTITAADDNAGWPGDAAISVVHDYSGNAAGMDTTRIDAAHNRGFIASQSFKMQSYTTASVADGTRDAAIATLAAACIAREPKEIWLCYYHEPEDDFTTDAARTSYRAAYRRIVTRCRDVHGVTNVSWFPIYMNPYTFSPSSGRDWRKFHPDWNGAGWHSDILMDMMGMDTYEPLPWSVATYGPWQTTNRSHKSYPQRWAEAFSDFAVPGTPEWDFVIPEFGMSNAMSTDPNWDDWCLEAQQFSQENRIKAFIYWDNSDDLGRWSFDQKAGRPHSDANGTKIMGWERLVEGSVKMALTT